MVFSPADQPPLGGDVTGTGYLYCAAAFVKPFFMDVHAASTPDCMCSHADSLAVRISSNFACARSRSARIALTCVSYPARMSALICSPLAFSLSTSASHFLISDSIVVKYSSFLPMAFLHYG